MATFDPSWFTGSYGGLIAIAFGAGAMGGYGFAARTILKSAQERIAEIKAEMKEREAKCEQRIAGLERRQLELEDMLLGRRSLGVFSALSVPRDMPPDLGRAADKLDDKP